MYLGKLHKIGTQFTLNPQMSAVLHTLANGPLDFIRTIGKMAVATLLMKKGR